MSQQSYFVSILQRYQQQATHRFAPQNLVTDISTYVSLLLSFADRFSRSFLANSFSVESSSVRKTVKLSLSE